MVNQVVCSVALRVFVLMISNSFMQLIQHFVVLHPSHFRHDSVDRLGFLLCGGKLPPAILIASRGGSVGAVSNGPNKKAKERAGG